MAKARRRGSRGEAAAGRRPPEGGANDVHNQSSDRLQGGNSPRVQSPAGFEAGPRHRHCPGADELRPKLKRIQQIGAHMSTIETTNGIQRKRCRNQRCRMKLPTPVDNPHKAFCTRGCYDGFYRNRCRACEADLRKTGKPGDANRRFCRPPNRCAAEAQKWAEKYSFGVLPLAPPVQAANSVRNAHSTGIKTRHKSLRAWQWVTDELEHEL